jgi:DNA-binding MarR family transcriptional regulator
MKHSEKIDALDVARTLVRLLPSIRRLLYDGMKREHPALPKTQLMVLMTLALDGPQTMTSIHQVIGIEKGSLTSVIDALVEKGLVSRGSESGDRRKIIVSLTEKGTSLADECRAGLSVYVERKIEKLSADDLRTVKSTSAILKGILDKV